MANNRFSDNQFRLFIFWTVFAIFGARKEVVDASQYLARAQCLPHQMPVVLLYRDPVTFNFTVVEHLGTGIGMEDLLSSSSSPSSNITNNTAQKGISGIGTAIPDQFRSLEAGIQPPASQIVENDGTPGWNRNRQKNDENAFYDIYQNQRYVSGGVDRSLVASNATMLNIDTVDDDRNNKSNFFYARECGCFAPRNPVVYCPFVIESCLINLQEGALPGCRNVKSEAASGYTFQLVAICWFAVLAICLVLPVGTGAHFRDYIFSFCYRKWPEVIVDRIIADRPDRARDLIRSQFRRQAQIERSTHRTQTINEADTGGRNELEVTGDQTGGDQPTGIELQVFSNGRSDPIGIRHQPTSLVLKIRTFHSSLDESLNKNDRSKNNPIDEEMGRKNEIECTICFCRLQDGDRVGELCCNHVFHVSCLKQWLKRKNVCPLCQCNEIAKPQYHENNIIGSEDITTENN